MLLLNVKLTRHVTALNDHLCRSGVVPLLLYTVPAEAFKPILFMGKGRFTGSYPTAQTKIDES